MSQMERKRYIEFLQSQTKEKVLRGMKAVQAKYEELLRESETLFEAEYGVFSEMVDKLYIGMVRNKLHLNGCWSSMNEDEAMQNARIAVWMMVKKDRANGNQRENFVAVCKGIYFHKEMDVVREGLTYWNHCEEMDGGGEDEDGRKPKGEIPWPNTPWIDLLGMERRRIFDIAFLGYCETLLAFDAKPQNGLALYFCRISPHILHINNNISTIPDTKGSSPKWAFQRMGKKTVETLGRESEGELQREVAAELRWREEFWRQMEEFFHLQMDMKLAPTACRLGDVVYTEAFREKEVGHMEEYMHKVVTKAWLLRMKKERGFLAEVKEYFADMGKLSKLMEGGR